MQWLLEVLAGIVIVTVVIGVIGLIGYLAWFALKKKSIGEMLARHFGRVSVSEIAVNERQFPVHIRADVQGAVESFLHDVTIASFCSVRVEQGLGGVDFSTLLTGGSIPFVNPVAIGPPQYEQIDIGESEPIRTLASGLWLLERDGTKFAVLYAPNCELGDCGVSRRVRLQVASLPNGSQQNVADDFFRHVERQVLTAKCYRGKILSFEQESSYFGQAHGVKVHRLGKVDREDVILPDKTLELLDRNVVRFVARREALRDLKMGTRKGLLFYGPPGTGKTHTIRYLAGALPGHTTFLISAEQVSLLGEYMTMARLLQPSIVVIEDVDLIARERTQMRHPGAEVLLNKLLNEMDGLREDCDILFILTTNRPEELEAALASRPGRIDQAIEFPLPDEPGRTKLVRLYAGGLTVSDDLVQAVVARTQNVSASFIKELMRRAAQCCIHRGQSRELILDDIQGALEEMLFAGGSLNLKLLGAEQRIGTDAV